MRINHLKRREFITLIGGAATWPLVARAQQPDRVRRIGVLMGRAESDQEGQSYAAAFLRGLAALGWMPGRNLKIDYRWQAGDIGQAQAFANELVELRGGPGRPKGAVARSTREIKTALLQAVENTGDKKALEQATAAAMAGAQAAGEKVKAN